MREMKSYCWERVINRNLHRALDQRAFHFRQNDRKIKLSRYLMCHILGSSRTQIGLSSLQRVVRQHETITPLDDEADICRKDMFLQLGRRSLHRTLFHLILNAVEQSCLSQHDKQLIVDYWQYFFFHFVHLSNDNHKMEPTVQIFFKLRHNNGYRFLLGQNMTFQTSFSRSVESLHLNSLPSQILIGLMWSRRLIIASRQIYIFFRLYHLLFQRYEFAWKLGDNPTSSGCQSDSSSQNHPRIAAFDTLVRGLLDGSVDADRYEDGCRLLFSTPSFVFFSIDKLIVQLLKQLQCVVNDIQSRKLVDLWKEREVFKRKKHLDDCANSFSGVCINPSVLSSKSRV